MCGDRVWGCCSLLGVVGGCWGRGLHYCAAAALLLGGVRVFALIDLVDGVG